MNSKHRIAFVIVSCVAAGFAFYATGKHSYSFYTLTRWIIFLVCGYGVLLFHNRFWKSPAPLYAIAGILFNPILPFHFHRSTWHVLDIAVGITLLALLASKPCREN